MKPGQDNVSDASGLRNPAGTAGSGGGLSSPDVVNELIFSRATPQSLRHHALWLAWTSHKGRSVRLGSLLQINTHLMQSPAGHGLIAALRKYWRLMRATWQTLMSQRPRIVVVQNPPIVLALTVALYARRTGSQYIIDSHTGAIIGSRWGWSLPLHRHLSRGALATIVTNSGLGAVLEGNRPGQAGRILVLEDPPIQLSGSATPVRPRRGARRVVVISTYSHDEPIEAVIDAAKQLPDVWFFVTGDAQRLPAAIRSRCPANVRLTGWLTDEEYADLLHEANVVIALTTRNFTLLCGAFEALYAAQPLVTSNWPALQHAIPQGAIFATPTPDGIREAVQTALLHEDELRSAMFELARRKQAQWQESFLRLRELINE